MKNKINRRELLLTQACGVALALVSSRVHAFQRAAALDRYSHWLSQLGADLKQVANQVQDDQPITADDIGQWCVKSIVPGSRSAINFAEWLDLAHRFRNRRSRGEIFLLEHAQIMDLFASSIPAGVGGLYPESPNSNFPDRTLTVWYMHIHGGNELQQYFDSKHYFKPYHLPRDGELERAAYPFLLFEDTGSTLRLGGMGAEWYGAATWLNSSLHL
jgi:hypothetical protein